MSEYKRLTERRNHIVIDKCGNCENVNNPQGCYPSDCHRIMKYRLAELEDKIENGTLIEFPRITETVYGLEWTVEYVSNLRTGTGIAKVFCGTKEQAKGVLEIVKKYGYPKQEEIEKLQE